MKFFEKRKNNNSGKGGQKKANKAGFQEEGKVFVLDDFKRRGGFPFFVHDFASGAEAIAKEERGWAFGSEFESNAIEIHAGVSGFFDVAIKDGSLLRGGL